MFNASERVFDRGRQDRRGNYPVVNRIVPIGAPVKGAMLIGNGPDVLTRVTMVGDDMGLDPGIGTCGKDGRGVPVGVGQPTMLISSLTVGGTA